MYQSYFCMNKRPFGATPQLGAYFPAASQEEALATLRYVITQGRGVGLLTGLSGTGKTMVCHRLAASLEPTFTTAMVTNTNMTTAKALLQAILYDFNLPYHGIEEQELRLNLSDFLLGKYAGGGRTVLIVDEAQNLAPALFEELRMLGNLEGEMDKLLQIVLVGHPRLIDVLRRPELDSMKQRIGARAKVEALSDEETIGYIRYQLEYAGVAPKKLFTYDAMTAVFEASSGVPRLINQLCEHALLLAYVAEASCVDQRIVEEASADLDRVAGGAAVETVGQVRVDRDQPNATDKREATDGSEYPVALVSTPEQDDPQKRAEDSREIIAEEPVPILPKVTATSSKEQAMWVTTERSTEAEFAQEEVIVDQYAMMDAARAARQRAPQQAAPSQRTGQPQCSAHQLETKLPAAPTPDALIDVLSFDQLSTVATTGDHSVEQSAASSPFIGPTDQPAVYEIGAGMAERSPSVPEPETEPLTDPAPEILVIEDRSRRFGNRARVDGPQPPAGRGAGVYRRLFSYARKTER